MAVKVNIGSKSTLPKYSDEELTILADRAGLTLPLLKELHSAGHATYQAIGHDLAECRDRGVLASREEIVEVILDASYMEMYAAPSPELRLWLRDKSVGGKCKLEDIYAAMAAGFPYSEYE